MTSMSLDAAVAAIGAQLTEMGTRSLAAGASSMPAVTGLAPAGAEEVSMQAAAAFAAEAAAILAAHTATQEELLRAGAALVDIARIYEQADVEAAGSLVAGGNQFSSQAFAAAANVGAGLASAEALPGALGAAVRTPLVTNLIEGVTAANSSGTLPAAANAASTVLSAGTGPLSSLSSVASMGGTAGGGAAAVPTALTGEEEPSTRDDPADQQTGEQLL
jgi:hypothetical protein